LKLKDGDFEKAIELAVSRGWVMNRDGMMALTTAGFEVSKWSRWGRHRSRSAAAF
jgi:hypothetical protein